jgi:Domain of unknown function (DUF4342)
MMNEEPGATRKMETMVAEPAPRTDEFHLTGDSVLAKIKELVHEGNVRRIVIKNPDGHVIVEFPLTAGVVGVMLLPMWAALGAIIALAADLTIVVERRD